MSGLKKLKTAVIYGGLSLLAFLCLFFFYCLIINATRSHPEISKGFSFIPGKSFGANLYNVLHNKNLPVLHGIANSFLIAGSSAALSVYVSALTAYAIHAYEFRLRRVVYLFIILVMMIPTQVTTLGFLTLIGKMGLTDSFLPLILPSMAAPVVFYFMVSYFESNLALEIVESARIDGSNEFYTFNFIVLPIVKPALAVQGIFAFVASWNNYFVPALVLRSNTKKTLPILIAQLRSADFLKFDMGQVYMLITIAIIPVAVIYLCLSKFIIGGIMAGSVKG